MNTFLISAADILSQPWGMAIFLLIDAAIHWEYAIANSGVVNGISANSRIVSITPWWRTAIDGAITAFSVLAAAGAAALIAGTALNWRKKLLEKRVEGKKDETV